MRVLHVVACLGREAGGPARSVQGLVAALCKRGVDAWIWPLDNAEPWIPGVRKIILTQSNNPNNRTIEQFDLVHIHGIWDWRLHKVAAMCQKAGVKYVIAPRGMLEPWSLKQKGLKKRIARWLYQDRDLHLAAALHATAESEAEQLRRLGFKNRIIMSPNGVNVPEEKFQSFKVPKSQGLEGKRVESVRRVLFVSRMHPKKGVLELVESWARVMKRGNDVVKNRVTENWYDVVMPEDIQTMPTIRVSATEKVLADRRAIKGIFRGFGIVENANDGRKVTFPSKSAGKMLGQRGVNLYRLAGSFAEMFRASRRAWSETEAEIADHRAHRNIGAYHQYIAKFNDGADDCYIRFTVREEKGTKNSRNEVHSSTVSRITVYKAKGAELSNLGHAQAEDSTPFVDNKISYFFTRVNPTWLCELVYTMNGPEEKAYEQKVKERIRELGMTYGEMAHGVLSVKSGKDSASPFPAGQSPDFIFTGALDDEKKWEAYGRADLFVLPTYSENFGIVVAEALWAGVPVITTKGTPWAELEERRCGWWIDLPGAKGEGEGRRRRGEKKAKVEGEGEWRALDDALREATLTSDIDLDILGRNGRALVSERYTWAAVCERMIEGYEKVKG